MRKCVRLSYLSTTQPGALIKRFYKSAQFKVNPDKKHPLHNYLITLDGRSVRTPYQNTLAVPSAMLALLLTFQFNRQEQYMHPGDMPLLALCRTGVDADIEGHLRQDLISPIYAFITTDSLLFREDKYRVQHAKQCDPLVCAFAQRFAANFAYSDDITPPLIQLNPLFHLWVQGLNNWQLIGFETMVIWMKSTIAAWNLAAAAHSSQHIIAAACLEQHTQMSLNGDVEEKFMDFNQIKLMVSCGHIMYQFGK